VIYKTQNPVTRDKKGSEKEKEKKRRGKGHTQ
jgi:hypothetical protein